MDTVEVPDAWSVSMQHVPLEPTPSAATRAELSADFEALLLQLLPSAYGYAFRLTRNRGDAEDLMQEAALRACRGAKSFEPGTHFKAWFFRIVIRCFWEKHRHAQRRPQTVDFDDTPDLYLYKQMRQTGVSAVHEDPMSELLDRMGIERVVAAIALLPEEYGSVATLYFMEDFAYREIAHVLDIPVGTVRSRLHRARKMLQKSLWQIAVDAGIIADLKGAGI
ncbi:MAG: sigma-70 family RNA polymerase sigma factor [Gemmatimonadota bacterium]